MESNADRMITFDRAGWRFMYRLAAVAIRDSQVLLHQMEGEDTWALPGGRAELGETAVDGLLREMREEMDVDVEIVRLLWIVENFFTLGDRDTHEIGLYFLIELPHDYEGLRRDTFFGLEGGSRLTFRWFDPASLGKEALYPTFLRTALASLPDRPIHIVNRQHR